jgi:hypothetical protein
MGWRIDGDPGTLFNDPQQGPQVLRLMLAMNALDSLHRPLLETMRPTYQGRYSKPCAVGDRLIYLGMIYGALTEALSAYAALRGPIERAANTADSELAPSVQILRDACEKGGQFRSAICERVRDAAGFHWNTTRIKAALDGMPPSLVQTLFRCDNTDENRHTCRYVIADSVVASILTPNGSTDELGTATKEAITVTKAFFAVIEAALAQLMVEAGCKRFDD